MEDFSNATFDSITRSHERVGSLGCGIGLSGMLVALLSHILVNYVRSAARYHNL